MVKLIIGICIGFIIGICIGFIMGVWWFGANKQK